MAGAPSLAVWKTGPGTWQQKINGCFWIPQKVGKRWHIIHQLVVYTTYILPSGGLYATYHLLREPETTIEKITLPETNIAPENRPSQKETSIPTIHFLARTVSV